MSPAAEASIDGELKELDRRREARRPEMARQLKGRRGQKETVRGVHAVKREVTSGRKDETARVTEVARGPVKRWQKASALPALPDLPGYHVAYVRRDNQQRGDHANLNEHIQEGWEPCRRTDFPGVYLSTQSLGEFGQCIGNASSIAMKIPNELWAQRNAHYNKQRDRTTKAVGQPDPTLSFGGGVSHEHMPIVEDKSTLTSTQRPMRGRRAPVRIEE